MPTLGNVKSMGHIQTLLFNADFVLLLFECVVFCTEAYNISVRGALLVEPEDQIHQLEVCGPN